MSHRQRQWLRLAALEAAILAIGLGSLVLLDYALDAALESGLLAAGIGLAAD
ncbi:MAG: hypothetical protein N3D71_07530 [Burkholderiaceae bacterium]|jgi:hypothetical protein|nr:hypothetical protein [Burkholderiaceae bacterium]